MAEHSKTSQRTSSRQSLRARASMSPSQIKAYLLARETLRRIARQSSGNQTTWH
jgi:hypothetical protein